MTRGNQREQDRLKAQKKAASQNKNKPRQSASSLAQRREQDAEIIRKKMEVRRWPILTCRHVIALLLIPLLLLTFYM